MMKLVLLALVLLYSQRVLEHLGRCHEADHTFLSAYLTRNTQMQHGSVYHHHFDGAAGEPTGHEHCMHQHFSEFHLKNAKANRRTLDCVAAFCVKPEASEYIRDFIGHKLPYGIGTQINSLIPQYLMAQSFLI